MKMLFLFLLVAGPCCVWGQTGPVPADRPRLIVPGPRQPLWFPRADGNGLERLLPGGNFGDSALPRRVFLSSRAEMRVLGPDRMPCVAANPELVERMPVDRGRSADRMPNGR